MSGSPFMFKNSTDKNRKLFMRGILACIIIYKEARTLRECNGAQQLSEAGTHTRTGVIGVGQIAAVNPVCVSAVWHARVTCQAAEIGGIRRFTDQHFYCNTTPGQLYV